MYNITDTTAVNSIAQNHVLVQLDPSIQEQAKILQLTGTCKLESILDLGNTKAAENMLQNSRPAPTYTLKLYDYSRSYSEDHVDKLERKFDQIFKKLDMTISGAGNFTVSSTLRQKGKQICEHCSKIGHSKRPLLQT